MRLGVFGGTFDPIHFGHLRMAEEARERLALDRVLFIPAFISPFKTGEPVTPGLQRAEMLRIALQGNPGFALSTVEIERPGPSYSVETLRGLRAEFPKAELFFLTGTDALEGLPKWHQPEVLLELATFVAVTRPGTDEAEVERALAVLPVDWHSRVSFMRMPGLDISATDIRNRVRAGRSIRYLTPLGVVEYIWAHGLYTSGVGVAPGDPD